MNETERDFKKPESKTSAKSKNNILRFDIAGKMGYSWRV